MASIKRPQLSRANIPSEVIATSVVDPTKFATAAVTLNPVVVTLSSSGSTSLIGGQSATFTAKVSGTSNTSVTWSLSPQVGTITSGVYQAPAVIASQQTVTVFHKCRGFHQNRERSRFLNTGGSNGGAGLCVAGRRCFGDLHRFGDRNQQHGGYLVLKSGRGDGLERSLHGAGHDQQRADRDNYRDERGGYHKDRERQPSH